MPIRQIASLCLIAMGLATQSCPAKDAPLQSLSMEHFRDSATVTDDPIAGVTTVDTEKGYVEHHGLLGAVWNDEYLTGTVDRKTGQRAFQVIVEVTYRGARRAYGESRFQDVNGPLVVPAVLLKTTAVNCPTGECTYTDRVSFPIDEALLRALGARPAGVTPALWYYTLTAKPRGDYAGAISRAEIAGFLAKVDEYTGSAPPAVLHPTAGAKPELGIGVLHVEPSEQQPARSGVLVTAVSRGSAADKAGIIVGDIVHEIDGRLVDSAAELQAAIAAPAANAVIAIKIYRGTTEMTLSATL